MHPETKKLTQKKHALSNTNTDRKSKATAKRDRSGAVLLSEIRRFVDRGTHIMSDGLASYRNLPVNEYFHDVVIHNNEFVHSFDPTVHTQNIEIRNRFSNPLHMKIEIRSVGRGICPLATSTMNEWPDAWRINERAIFPLPV